MSNEFVLHEWISTNTVYYWYITWIKRWFAVSFTLNDILHHWFCFFYIIKSLHFQRWGYTYEKQEMFFKHLCLLKIIVKHIVNIIILLSQEQWQFWIWPLLNIYLLKPDIWTCDLNCHQLQFLVTCHAKTIRYKILTGQCNLL